MRFLESIQVADHKLLFACFYSQIRLKKYAYHLSKTGDGYLYVILPLIYMLFGYEVGKLFCWLAICAFITERCAYYVLKKNLKRRRPPEVFPDFKSLVTASDEFSFPSGHTSAAFLFTTLCVLWFGPVMAPLYIWAGCVGFSRVLLGVHFPTDIVAGAVIGTSVAMGTFSILM